MTTMLPTVATFVAAELDIVCDGLRYLAATLGSRGERARRARVDVLCEHLAAAATGDRPISVGLTAEELGEVQAGLRLRDADLRTAAAREGIDADLAHAIAATIAVSDRLQGLGDGRRTVDGVVRLVGCRCGIEHAMVGATNALEATLGPLGWQLTDEGWACPWCAPTRV